MQEGNLSQGSLGLPPTNSEHLLPQGVSVFTLIIGQTPDKGIWMFLIHFFFMDSFVHSFTSIHLHPLCAGDLGEAPRTQLALPSSEADAPEMTYTQ